MKQFGLIAVLVLLGALAACSAPSNPVVETVLDPAIPGSIIRIGLDPSLPPFESVNANGEPVGFDIDLIKQIGARVGFKVGFVKTELNQVYDLVGGCRVDAAISAIPINKELTLRMDFSDAYYTTGQMIVVKKGNIKITGRDALAGMTVGTPAGTLSALATREIPGALPKPNGTVYASFQDLVTGSIDAVIIDKPRAQSYVKIKPNNLKTVGSEFGTVQYGIAVCKERGALLKQINDSLKILRADGTLSRLTQNWITSSFR